MVRTLGFHPNNVGSIPANLILRPAPLTPYFNYFFLKPQIYPNFSPRYTFTFISLFSPYSLKNIRLLASSMSSDYSSSNTTTKFTKIFVKQSYLLLVWVSYLTKYSTTTSTNHSQISSESASTTFLTKKPSIVFLPKRKTKLTFLKTPMAHKTFSQEQVSFSFFKVSISFNPAPRIPTYNEFFVAPESVNAGLLVYTFLYNNIPFVSTNLFFLHRLKYSFSLSSKTFFTYNFR